MTTATAEVTHEVILEELSDPWELINASEAQVREALADYPEKGARTILGMLGFVREGLEEVAAGRPVPQLVRDKAVIPLAAFAEDNREALAGSMWEALREPLTTLLWLVLDDLKPGRAYVCEYCGRIGPAERSDKRYCNANCRAAAAYDRAIN